MNRLEKSLYKKSEGFTLIELIVVMAVLGMISSIVLSRFISVRELAEKTVCESNRTTLARHYEIYLQTVKSGDSNFTQFMIENFDKICPSGGVINYEDEKVKCSIHKNEDDEDVPWL